MRPELRIAVLVALAPLAPACAGGPPSAPAKDWREYSAHLDAADPAGRFVEATALFLGTPYFNGPLGEGDHGGPDPDPRVDFARADCVTYLEQSLALALAVPERPESFLDALDAIRYLDGEVGFASRNHYMVRDWIPANEWLLKDVTASVGGDHTRRVHRTIDRVAFLRDQGAEPRPGVDDVRELTIDIIPSASVAAVQSGIRAGDLVFWVGGVEGIFVLHTGLAVRGDGGDLLFRHGSSRAGRALDEPFAAYAKRQKFEGFLVLRLRGEAAWPKAASG